jgi:phosphoesterase RecJ-like protein
MKQRNRRIRMSVKMSNEKELQTIWSIIESGSSFVLSSHVKMDGDGLGSMLAMRLVLIGMGKTVRVVHVDPVPKMYLFLPGADSVCSPADLPADERFDVGIVLDSGALPRLGAAAEIVQRSDTLINIDHHADWRDFGAVNLIDLEASAVGETLYRLFDQAGVTIGKDVATALYTSIATDTGGFRYSSTTCRTHQIAAALIEQGVDPGEISQHLYENQPLPTIRLLGMALDTIEQACDGRVTWMSIDAEMLRASGAGPEHVEGFVNYPRSVDGTAVAILFAELDPGKTKASIRSNVDIDVSELAARFGGGGHYRAAGCTIEAPLERAREQLIAACQEMLESRTDE